MIKKPFFGFGKPKLKYSGTESLEQGDIKEIPLPERVTLFLKAPDINLEDVLLKTGDEVKTGQRLKLLQRGESYLTSTVTGTVADISRNIGYFGQTHISVSIDSGEKDRWDNEFAEAGKTPNTENVLNFLNSLPGVSDFAPLINADPPLNTIIINGFDKDLLIATNQMIVKTEAEGLTEGVAHLKEITGAGRIIMVVPPGLKAEAEKSGAEVRIIDPLYPNALPQLIMNNLLDKAVPPGGSCEEMGVGFINAEAVAALKSAFGEGRVPIHKVITVIDKDCKTVGVKTRIGTPVKDILNALNITANQGDRIVLGGPMSGQGVYSEEMPVMPDTDAVMVQDKEEVLLSSDDPCINCGECIRACPAKIPVNMLIRLLENGLYEEAAKDYELLSCIECGLCSYVCEARIPIFHYIMLGKYELALTENAEELNA